MLVPALYALQNVPLPYSEKYGNTTMNIGKVAGGVAANVIAEDAAADIAIRIADGTPSSVGKIVLDTIKKAGEELDVTIREGYGPIYIDSDVKGEYSRSQGLSVAKTYSGFDKIVVSYGTDIPNLQGDHKRYLYGPGGERNTSYSILDYLVRRVGWICSLPRHVFG
jgi:acetylornithine deacetylase